MSKTTPIQEAMNCFNGSNATWSGSDIAKVLSMYLHNEKQTMQECWLDGQLNGDPMNPKQTDTFETFYSQYNLK